MDELDNDKSDSNENISTHFTPSAACKKKRKPNLALQPVSFSARSKDTTNDFKEVAR